MMLDDAYNITQWSDQMPSMLHSSMHIDESMMFRQWSDL